MIKKLLFITIVLLPCIQPCYSQKIKTDANVVGHVIHEGKHLPFVSIGVKGTTIGTVTDETGHYQLVNLPPGTHTIFVSMVGFRSEEHIIELEKDKTITLNFELEKDVLNIDEVVISADRAEQKRTMAPVIVNTISPRIFNASHSVTLGEGLNFTPGLRLENNCQNCGFSQVRMNGMEGPYSQVLINSRPIFSGLAGVYGLELIPANMIEKVEVVRGGGSALFGSNAVAGTINIVLKDPKTNSYEAGINYALTGAGVNGTGGVAPDYSVNFNTTIVSADLKTGVSLYGFTRNRDMFDANNDSFSEISLMENLTFGGRLFHRFGYRDKLSLDFFAINDERNGGNRQEYPLHERDVAEAVTHNMKVAGITYDRFFREYDQLSVYISGQFLNRESYYGAGRSLSDYGNSTDHTYNTGFHYKAQIGASSLMFGAEHLGDLLIDKKLGYRDIENVFIDFSDSSVHFTHTDNTIVSNQLLATSGAFMQYDAKIERLRINAGMRLDRYKVKDMVNDEETKSGTVVSPRLSLMYELMDDLQARISYSQGYRAPQIFDEDLHIETSGSRRVIHINDPGLKQETSHSIMASLDFNRLIGTVYTGLLIEGFHTTLVDAFANEFGEPDDDGTVIYTRVNAEGGAVVKGVNMELEMRPSQRISLTSGLTLQTSRFSEPQEVFDERRFFRTPNQYGYFAFNYDFFKNTTVSSTGNYTGRMLVPYFGTENPEGELRETDRFFDLGVKLSHTVKLNGASVEFFGGVKNFFNSYQDDFDIGEDRDPAYIYGPMAPRTIYVGIRFGNML